MKTFFILLALLLPPFIQDKITLEELDKAEGLLGVVIIKNDQTVFKKFYNSQSEDDLCNIYSETKSLMAILIGIAIDKGFIKSIDQPISDFFTQILKDTSKVKRLITIKHVMDQTSGLPAFEWPDTTLSSKANPTEFKLEAPPGTLWVYNTAATHLLSAIITIATKAETPKFADENLFKPLGITNYQWNKRNDGYYDGGGGLLWMRTVDFAKIGNLLLHKGKHNNKQLISEQYINQLFTHEGKQMLSWGLKGSVYGLCWYEAQYKGR